LERRLEEGSKERHYAAMILESTAQAEALTKQLLGFARRRSEDGPPAQVHIHRAVETAADLLRPSCRRIGIRLELQAEPCTTLGDRNQLESALVNLGLNARDAMPDGGTLIFRTRLLAPDGSEHETLPADHCEGAYLRLEIVDTGCGMDDETSRHAFEPFYSTKPRGEGTGLGLVSVYGAMQAHRGTVDIHSAPGKGTTVKLLFPLVAAAPDAAPAAFRPGRILLADDEDLVRELTATRLRDLGHTVEAFPDGESLLAAFAHRRGETDLVLLDVLMPGMDGLEVFHRVREIDPEARVLFVTGYADQARLGAALEDGAFDIIHKPFDSEELCVTVARALGDRHAPFASDSPARA
ncbi:MAG: response regulator, partial [Planctomycetota bacterium]